MARVKTPEIPPLVKLLCEDRRYKLEAYQFVQAGLGYAQEVLGMGGQPAEPADDDDEDEEERRPLRHVSGQQLSLAFKRLAQEQYGYLAKLVLNSWGIHSTADFGEIVYNLIKIGMMTKSDDDRREDFDHVYDFEGALMREYRITKAE